MLSRSYIVANTGEQRCIGNLAQRVDAATYKAKLSWLSSSTLENYRPSVTLTTKAMLDVIIKETHYFARKKGGIFQETVIT